MAALDTVGITELLGLDDFSHVDLDAVYSVIEEFGKLAEGEIAQGDRVGDVIGATLHSESNSVTTPQEFHRAYELFVAGGWAALGLPLEHGGGGFPTVISTVLQELFASANLALSLNPVLTQGSIEALLQWGSEEQQALFLPKLSTGEWSGTMNLTEPQAGSDLGEIRTIATPNSDGTWSVSGTKIFITWGEHDLVENIVHLVLARTPDAPSGTKGLSLFIVPKFNVNANGTLAERNSLRVQSLEHKLGIHGSPTCVMEFDGATGILVGPLHGGMKAMFTMMNNARLAIGVQGPAVAERAYQHALDYANNREQGRAAGTTPPASSPIIQHPDVQRMLLLMNTTTQAARMLIFLATTEKDFAHHAATSEERDKAQEMVDLLTPIAKAWGTDRSVLATSLGVQIFGGMGYIEESGIAQRLRDVRIAPIYEGTNGIQSLDLVFRKLPRNSGQWATSLLADVRSSLEEIAATAPQLAASSERVLDALVALEQATAWMINAVSSSPTDAQAGATAYLELFGNVLGGWLMVKRAARSIAKGATEANRYTNEANFFTIEIVTTGIGLASVVTAGADRLSSLVN